MAGFGIDRYGPISLLRPRISRAHTVSTQVQDQCLGPWASETIVVGLIASGGSVFYQTGFSNTQTSVGANAHFLAEGMPLMVNVGTPGTTDRHNYVAVRSADPDVAVQFYVTEFE